MEDIRQATCDRVWQTKITGLRIEGWETTNKGSSCYYLIWESNIVAWKVAPPRMNYSVFNIGDGSVAVGQKRSGSTYS
jgi:hypothetical protein